VSQHRYLTRGLETKKCLFFRRFLMAVTNSNDNSRVPEHGRTPASDRMLEVAFGTTDPNITAFPHCIFPAGAKSLRSVREVVASPIGVWGNSKPMVDAGDGGYLEPPDSRIIADFKLWALPKNQEHAIGHGGRLPGFIAVIPAYTPESILSQMYDADIGEDQFSYDNCIRLLPDWIEALGWAYVPLEPQAAYAMFVAATPNRSLLDQVKSRLGADGIRPVFEIVSAAGRQKWTGPLLDL
jgi:hypothetical protein